VHSKLLNARSCYLFYSKLDKLIDTLNQKSLI